MRKKIPTDREQVPSGDSFWFADCPSSVGTGLKGYRTPFLAGDRYDSANERKSVNTRAFSGTDSQNLLGRCHENRRVTSTFNDLGEIGPHFKCIVDNAIVDRVVHCEAFFSGVRRRSDLVNVHSIRNGNQFQIVRLEDFERQTEVAG
jgi:hypothetical protein